ARRGPRRGLRPLPATQPAQRPPSTEGLLRGSAVPIPLHHTKHMFDLSTRETSAFDIFFSVRAVTIAIDDPRVDDVRALLQRHLAFAYETTPPEGVYTLDVDGLLDRGVTFFSARADG